MKLHVWRVVVLSIGLLATPSWGQSVLGPEDHCAEGDLQPNVHAWYPRWSNVERPGENTHLCQLRSFYEPDEGVCFCEHDVFVAGDVVSVYKFDTPFGLWSAREFVETLQIFTEADAAAAAYAEPFVTPVSGLSRRECTSEPVDGNCEEYFTEQLVLKQAGLVFRGLPPGNYAVEQDLDHPAEQIFNFTFEKARVNFRVLAHEHAHDLGRPWVFGSVNCP
jgi:hypothetical protein